MVVLDTCALIWWTLAPQELSVPAAAACARIGIDGAIVSSISIWEVGLAQRRGRVELGASLDEYVARLRRQPGLRIVPVDETIWVANLALPWDHADPADRTIVATAQLRGLPLVTKDHAIRGFYPNCIW